MTRSAPGRERAVLLLLGLAGAVVTLAAGAPVWVRAQVRTAVGVAEVVADGRSAAPVATALGLVGLAAVLASLIGRRFARTVAALLLLAAGAGVVTASARVPGEAAAAVAGPARQAASVTSAEISGLRVAPWPWVSAGGGVLLVLAGTGVVLRSRRWATPARASRFERDAAIVRAAGPGAGPTAAEDPAATWDELSRGSDPTR
ncbi:Trp biosynthesis-associated membrane protein [Kineococcus gynurae]|uniref:Trp biosynthesis-associated membrane protein n=1 Tax=Kineococcus gynurae TaxID=452979 RepID=A0ABV5LQG1_9ACTN